MVVRIPSFAYQKGFGGHFHNDNSIAVLRDIPGIIIACPAHPEDAPSLLASCLKLAEQQRRVVVFLEPIALYATKDLHKPGDGLWLADYQGLKHPLPLDEVGIEGNGECLSIISYGNGYYLSRQAAHQLQRDNIPCQVIDLRWLTPLPEQALLHAIRNSKHVLIVDEGRRTGSLSETLCTLIMENRDPLPHIARITGEDTFIPLGPSSQYVLPSCQQIIERAKSLLKM